MTADESGARGARDARGLGALPHQSARDTRACSVDGCTSRHSRNYMMCRRHWLGLPKPLRDEVWASIKAEGLFSERYLEARTACFAHWSPDA